METNSIYSMEQFDNSSVIKEADLFIMSFDGEERSYYIWQQLSKDCVNYNKTVVLAYEEQQLMVDKSLMDSIKRNNGIVFEVANDQLAFVSIVKSIGFSRDDRIVIDISSMRVMHIFILLKYLKLIGCKRVQIVNTIPFDYLFKEEPFTSYRSFAGDLVVEEILGYSGVGEMSQDNDLIIFIGFEGALSLKIVEDTVYNNLQLINTIPSYYQKYKDISAINNYRVLELKNNTLLHVPADNPFEVYNTLDSIVSRDAAVCIAPLSTKPISLGVCLYALDHENVRIVYPISNIYDNKKSHDVYHSYVYIIDF